MANRQIGWSVESNLLQYILNQLKRITQLIGNLSSSSVTCAGVPACETDPVFTAWIGATPPAYPADIPTNYLRWVTAPTTPSDAGNQNEVAYDGMYFYLYNNDLSLWMRTAMSVDWPATTTSTTTIEPTTTTTTTLT